MRPRDANAAAPIAGRIIDTRIALAILPTGFDMVSRPFSIIQEGNT